MSVAIDPPPAGIAEICERYEVAELSLFGSAARGEFGPDRDDDVLVECEHPETKNLFDDPSLRFELEDLVGRPVDLVPKQGLKRLIEDDVPASARGIYGAR